MKTARKTNFHQAWLFDGKPEFVDVNVASSTPVEGGYVVAIEFANGVIHLAATRHPAKYVSAWRHNIRRYGIPDITRVLVSHPHFRHDAIKRGLVNLLAKYMDADSRFFRVSIETLTEKVQTLWAETRHQP